MSSIDETLRKLGAKPGVDLSGLGAFEPPPPPPPPAIASELHMTCSFQFGDEKMLPAGVGVTTPSERNRMLLMRTTDRLGADVVHLFFLDTDGFEAMLAHGIGACDPEHLTEVERMVAERRAYLDEREAEELGVSQTGDDVADPREPEVLGDRGKTPAE